MASLLHQPFSGTADDATATIKGTPRRARFWFTPWPDQRIIEGVFFLGIGIWASVRIGLHDVAGGVGCFVLVAALAVFVAAPGVYTLRHADEAAHYYGATRVKGDAQARAHPYLVVVAFIALCAFVGALGGHARESAGTREVGAIVGACFGLVVGVLRVRRGRLDASGVSERQPGEAKG